MKRFISLTTGPTEYGPKGQEGYFKNKKLGFELEITDNKSLHRFILTLDDMEGLKDQIESAIEYYKKFTETK